MIKQVIIPVLVLILSMIITGLVLFGIRYIAPSVLGFELSAGAFGILFVMGFPVVYGLFRQRLYRTLRETSQKELARQRIPVSQEVISTASCKLILSRVHAYVDRLRIYKVFINGAPVGQIADGETRTYELVPGSHEITVRIDWCETKPVRFSVGVGTIKKLSCGPNLDGIRFLIFPWYLTFERHSYLWLR